MIRARRPARSRRCSTSRACTTRSAATTWCSPRIARRSSWRRRARRCTSRTAAQLLRSQRSGPRRRRARQGARAAPAGRRHARAARADQAQGARRRSLRHGVREDPRDARNGRRLSDAPCCSDLTVNTVFDNGLGSSFQQYAAQVHDEEGARRYRTFADPIRSRQPARRPAARARVPQGRPRARVGAHRRATAGRAVVPHLLRHARAGRGVPRPRAGRRGRDALPRRRRGPPQPVRRLLRRPSHLAGRRADRALRVRADHAQGARRST